MKFDLKKFDSAAEYYRKALGKIKKQSIVAVLPDFRNRKGFYSIAPLSRAIDELKADLNVFVFEKESPMLEVLKDVWKTFEELKSGKKNRKTSALHEFIEIVEEKTKSRDFEKIFIPPEKIFYAKENGFELENSEKNAKGKKPLLNYKIDWLKERHWNKLLETTSLILTEGYALKKNEKFSVSFELIPSEKNLELPLEDYLDNFLIARAFALSAKKPGAIAKVSSSTARYSQLLPMDRVSDLSATIAGCEYSKEINEPVFKKFKALSKELDISKIKPNDAAMGIHGKGYGGKHFFGTKIGYPTPNKKSKWNSAGQMFLKPWWYQQTKIDGRAPKTRYAITETLPLENFIRTCNIPYSMMRSKNDFIQKIIDKSEKIIVKGKEFNRAKTNLEVFLNKNNLIWESDADVRDILNKAVWKKFKIKAGSYGNFPGGEVFFTPGKMNGTFLGDLVISIDQSYELNGKNPLVIETKNGFYKIISGEKKIIGKINEKKKESWKIIKDFEKHKSLPKEIIESYRKNFNRIGEFAINTNPRAKKSKYLIEMEKMSKMMHIALGSGFEPNRETMYHMDIVINAPRQKMDIYGLDKSKKQLWIMKKGKLLAK